MKLEQAEGNQFSKTYKIDIVRSLEKKDHEYFSFFVCRNPIERLKSLYGFSLDLGRFKKGKTPKNFKDFIKNSFSNSSILSKYNEHCQTSKHWTLIISIFQFMTYTPCFRYVLLVQDITMLLSRWRRSLMTQGYYL